MKPASLLFGFVLFVLLSPPCLMPQLPTSSPKATVPRLMRFSGAVANAGERRGVAGVTFSLYKDQEGGAALWMETQNVQLDSVGRYTALIGMTKPDGLPTELFASGEARWLGVQIEGQPELPRVLLLSVPYALKAADAETLGGKPASAFSLVAPLEAASTSTTTGAKPTSGVAAKDPSRGTAGFIARWTSNKTLGNAILFYQDASGRVGIGTTTPLSLLHVNGVTQIGLGTAIPAGILTARGLPTDQPPTNNATDGIQGFGGDAGNNGAVGGNGVVGTGGSGATAPSGVGGEGVVGNGGDKGGDGVVGNGANSLYTGGTGVIAYGGFGNDLGGRGIVAIGGTSGCCPSFDGDGLFATNVDGGTFNGTNAYAGDFDGDLNVSGAIFAGTKDFKIDHPLDPANKYLLHASVESSEMMTIYSGNAVMDESGEAVVRLPDWFEAINGDFRYQLTAIGAASPGLYIAQEIANHQFKIAGGKAGLKVSWQITAVRHDPYAKANPLVVEQPKNAQERGYYLHPRLYGVTAEKNIEWARHPGLMRKIKELKLKESRVKGTGGSVQ